MRDNEKEFKKLIDTVKENGREILYYGWKPAPDISGIIEEIRKNGSIKGTCM